MGFTIIRRDSAPTPKKVTPGLTRVKFNGPLLDRPIQFPEDVALMRGWLKAMGLQVGDRDCQALWDRLSREYYPFQRDPGSYAWLAVGMMSDIFSQHAREFLVPCDAGNAVR